MNILLARSSTEDAMLMRASLDERRSLDHEQRKTFLTPKIANQSWRTALWWALQVMRQDRPLFMFLGAVTLALNFMYLLFFIGGYIMRYFPH